MSWLLDLRLIPFFGFYLAVFFAVGTVLRFREYQVVLGLVASMPGRWPRLLKLVHEHSMVFLTWGTIPLIVRTVHVPAPAIVAVRLWVAAVVLGAAIRLAPK